MLDRHDALVDACVNGALSFQEFVDRYDNFPQAYALDGHESSESEKVLLKLYQDRVQFHFGVLEAISGLCREEDAAKPEYSRAGRFGPSEVVRRLNDFVKRSKVNAQ